MRHNLEAMTAAGDSIDRIVAVGGGTRLPLWTQVVSDITGIAQALPRYTLGASYGDALLGAIAAGLATEATEWNPVERLVEPDPVRHDGYQSQYALYRRLYSDTLASVHELSMLQHAQAGRRMAEIVVERITKVFPDGTRAVSDLDLAIPDGCLIVLVGPSGCGKTTLLRMVAGLERPTTGTSVSARRSSTMSLPRAETSPWSSRTMRSTRTCRCTTTWRLPCAAATSPSRIKQRVTDAAAMLGLTAHLKKKPAALSGGQRQRVAMGRAIVRQPQAFLMDEPLSNLDAKLRVEMRSEILRIQRDLGVTTIFVTHDQTEAMTMGDLVAVMRNGVIQQLDTPTAVFANPANLFVAGFIGSPPMNLIKATIHKDDTGLTAHAGSLRIPLTDRSPNRFAGYREVAVGIRPEDMTAADTTATPGEIVIHTRVDLRETLGREAYLHFTLDAEPVITDAARELGADTDAIALERLEQAASAGQSHLTARINAATGAEVGDPITLTVDPAMVAYFDLETGDAIRE